MIKTMHIDLFQDDEDDWARELAYLDSVDQMEYQMWLEQENQKIKPITKVEIVEIKQEEVKLDEN